MPSREAENEAFRVHNNNLKALISMDVIAIGMLVVDPNMALVSVPAVVVSLFLFVLNEEGLQAALQPKNGMYPQEFSSSDTIKGYDEKENTK
jgi:hypothetical protein